MIDEISEFDIRQLSEMNEVEDMIDQLHGLSRDRYQQSED
jgi:hypothetical protein